MKTLMLGGRVMAADIAHGLARQHDVTALSRFAELAPAEQGGVHRRRNPAHRPALAGQHINTPSRFDK